MKIKLYKPYQHWLKTGPIWVYSDPHFCDEDCLLMDKKWPTPDEQVNKINSKIGKKDTLIILGDIGNESWVKELKGYKVLILGNHDKGVSNYQKRYTVYYKDRNNVCASYDTYAEAYKDLFTRDTKETGDYGIFSNGLFDEVYEGPIFINEKILLSHEPIDLPFGINVHGHVHDGEQSVSRANTNACVNVCSNIRNYTPIRLDKIIEEFTVEDIHRQTINRAVLNKMSKKKGK